MTSSLDWQGRTGDAWADEWRRTERAFAAIAATLDAAIVAEAPEAGRAIDIGCGAGGTARALAAARPRLSVTGMDLSPALLEVARTRAAVPENVAFSAGNALELLPALTPVDLLVSRHGVMFFADPLAAFAALRRAARPGAPFVFSCFRARALNDWAMLADAVVGPVAAPAGYAPGPFALADAAFTADLLARAGWHGARHHAHDLPYVVGEDPDPLADALAFYRRIGPAASALAAAAPAGRARLEEALRAALARQLRGDAIVFTAAVAIWVAHAGEPQP